MLDITTNQASTNINNAAYRGYGIADSEAAAAELLLGEEDMMMDPLFEEDWLHENNLDILFDLFEEEVESKIGVEANNASSALFGTSPVTSYLFGTSPSLASALDLIYFDNHPTTSSAGSSSNNNINNMGNAAPTAAASSNPNAVILNTPSSSKTTTATILNPGVINQVASNGKSQQTNLYNLNGSRISSSNISSAQQVSHAIAVNNLTNSITNAMRIKRGFKKGQSEGTSLLAKPCLSSSGRTTSGNSGSSNISCNKKNSSKINSNSRKINSIISRNNGDKTSAKVTNYKSSTIIGNNTTNTESKRNGIDINYSKQSQHQNRERYYLHKCQQHVHYITGRAVIREHAYAVRGH